MVKNKIQEMWCNKLKLFQALGSLRYVRQQMCVTFDMVIYLSLGLWLFLWLLLKHHFDRVFDMDTRIRCADT